MDCENCRHLTVVGLHDTGPGTTNKKWQIKHLGTRKETQWYLLSVRKVLTSKSRAACISEAKLLGQLEVLPH